MSRGLRMKGRRLSHRARGTRRVVCADGFCRLRWGVDLFCEEGAYTTIASATAMLMVLALLFSASWAVWSASRSADVQVSADAAALSGANVVSSYYTVATVLDASVLSMGLAGFALAGTGMVGLLVPGANVAAKETLDAAVRTMKARNEFAASASRGLQRLEQTVPFLVAAQATRTCDAQDTERIGYSGTALALPRTSASEFPAIDEVQISTDGLEEAGEALDTIADELAVAAQETAKAKEAAWIADCGREGMNMQERAAKLSGIAGAENPDFASSVTWEPNVALSRTRAYYAWRLKNDAPENPGVEARADAAARGVFYEYAVECFADARVEERDDMMVSNVKLLPRNTDEARDTRLYSDARWPSTAEGTGVTLHFSSDCPGATGPAGRLLPLSAIDAGSARECSTCRFSIGDVGKVPAASTSIENGFEYHLREFAIALDDYVAASNHERELQRRAQTQAERAGDAFEDAIAVLGTVRPRIAPPGRNGCVALVVADEFAASESLQTSFAASGEVPRRGAVSAAALAPDAATAENNVLAQFCAGLEERVGSDGAVGLIDGVMDLWGKLLLSYADMGEGFDALLDGLIGKLDSFGLGPVARWLRDCLQGVVRGLGFEAVDLRLRKPVLTDSANVLRTSGMQGVADAQELLRKIPAGSSDPAALLQAFGYDAGEYLLSLEFTVAEIPLPGGGSIPLTVRLRDLTGIWEGDSQ